MCELRVIDSCRLRYEFEGTVSSLSPVRPGAGILVHGPDGAPVGTPAMLFSILWGDRKLPYAPGIHVDIPLLVGRYFVTYGRLRVPARVMADYHVERRLYISEAASGYEELLNLAETAVPLRLGGLGQGLSPYVIRRTWRYVESAERLRRKPKVHFTVLDALA